MKEMTREEQVRFQTDLGKALNEAKIGVYVKYGFSAAEISKFTGLSESVVKRVIVRLGKN